MAAAEQLLATLQTAGTEARTALEDYIDACQTGHGVERTAARLTLQRALSELARLSHRGPTGNDH